MLGRSYLSNANFLFSIFSRQADSLCTQFESGVQKATLGQSVNKFLYQKQPSALCLRNFLCFYSRLQFVVAYFAKK